MKTSFLRIDKITSLLFMLISFVACQNEEIVESQQTDQFTLKVEKGFGSRTQADEAGTVTWSKGDKMLVYGDNVEGVLTLQGEGGETTGTFSGFVFGNPDNLKWAIYPAEGAKTTEKGAEINLSKITYPNSNSPMVGEISGDKTVQLDHLCGMVRIPVENIPANAKVTLSGTDIAGTAEWDGVNFTPTSSTNTIEIEVPVSGNLKIDVPVFATSTETDKTFTLTIDGISCTFKSSIAVKKLNKNTNLTFKCTVENGKVTSIVKEDVVDESTSYYLPDGSTFNSIVGAFLEENNSLSKIKFIANSQTTSEALLLADENGTKAYMVANGEWLEIHTSAKNIIANIDCSYMFRENNYDDSKPATFSRIKHIDLGDKFDTSITENMIGMFFNCVELESINITSMRTPKVWRMYSMFSGCQKLTSLDISNFDTSKVLEMSFMFRGCESLTSLDVSNFNTSKVWRMNSMFSGCQKLTSLDVSKFNTDNVTDLSSMFSGCEYLMTIDVSKFNTSKVEKMDLMFSECKSLTSLDVNGFNTDNVKDMRGMFYGCESLTTIDVSKFNTSKVENMSAMFANCKTMKALDLSGFNTLKVTNMTGMFEGCEIIETINLSSFDTSNTTKMGNMFFRCSNLHSLDLSQFSFWKKPDVHNMLLSVAVDVEIYPIPIKVSEEGYNYLTQLTSDCGFNKRYVTFILDDSYFLPMGHIFNSSVMNYLELNPQLTKIKFVTESSNTTGTLLSTDNYGTKAYLIANGEWLEIHTSAEKFVAHSNSSDFFSRLENITHIELQNNLNTMNVTDMTGMFRGSSSLSTLDLSCFKTQMVTNMGGMFYECSSLTTLNLSSFNTEKVTYMQNMFDKCTSLTSLDLSNFNTEKVTDMSSMFFLCQSLKTLNLSNFNTSSVTSMKNMFTECNSLTALDLSHFNTSKVTDMHRIFQNCFKLQALNLSNFDTTKITDMEDMFDCCNSLISLDLRSFNTSNVTKMNNMFGRCTSLTSLILSNFNTSNVTDMHHMFYECTALKSLDLSSFNTSNVKDMSFMFLDCSSLTALNLTSFTFLDGVEIETENGNTTISVNVDGMFSEMNENIKIQVTEAGYNYLKAHTEAFGYGIDHENLEAIKTF